MQNLVGTYSKFVEKLIDTDLVTFESADGTTMIIHRIVINLLVPSAQERYRLSF